MAAEPADAVRVLLVEDDEDDYLITRDMLARQDRVPFTVDWRERLRRCAGGDPRASTTTCT